MHRCPALPHARFTYCALLGCSILGCLDVLDVPAAVDFIKACKNFDGGFGCTPGMTEDSRCQADTQCRLHCH